MIIERSLSECHPPYTYPLLSLFPLKPLIMFSLLHLPSSSPPAPSSSLWPCPPSSGPLVGAISNLRPNQDWATAFQARLECWRIRIKILPLLSSLLLLLPVLPGPLCPGRIPHPKWTSFPPPISPPSSFSIT